jgi:hypothetical protein
MYYHTYDLLRNCYCVGLAESANGIRWNKHGEVFSGGHGIGAGGAFDSQGASRRHVLLHKSTQNYMMFYEAVGEAGLHTIGLALSSDGVQWRRVGDTPVLGPGPEGTWDCGGVGAPCVVPLPDGRYRMYYVGTCTRQETKGNIHMRMGVAESEDTDGRQWRKL